MDPAFLFNTGKNVESQRYLGAHPCEMYGQNGWVFRVWAPRASLVFLCGSFNRWDSRQHPMERIGQTGIWQAFRTDVQLWDRYQYFVLGADGRGVYKADPFALHQELRPGTASVIYTAEAFPWEDKEFIESLPPAREPQPLNIYEVHLGSWRRYPDGNHFSYRDIAPQLAEYCLKMGYNAVELMPVLEHPLDDSWGYQVSGYFAPTSRYGTPEDLKFLVNQMHKAGVRVFLDWVPAHFPKDEFGLYRFDGSPCFEYADSRLGEQKSWGTMVFDYSKSEVRSFLLSSALYWLSEFHFDGLRIDAVSSMIYLNYARDDSVKNIYGGIDNLEALSFMRELNQLVAERFPHCLMMAEESTAYPRVTHPVEEEGLGFTHKWNMGWMHDTLDYMAVDYYARLYHHNKMTFSMTYAFSENYILPFSHDEVVHGKHSLIGRMPGDIWRQCASLRTCFAWQIGHPGAKLNFMGNEFGQFIEWRFKEELEWFMLSHDQHRKLQDFSAALNRLYLEHDALWKDDHSWDGFQWWQADDGLNSVFAFERSSGREHLLFILNMTPAVHPEYELRLGRPGSYRLILNSDEERWGGSSYLGETGKLLCTETNEEEETVLKVALPPLSAMIFSWEKKAKRHPQ